MEGEFNNLDINNTNITFSVATNNIATSDEATADPIYQRQMGTLYSKSKKVSKGITIVGISIAFTAIAVSTGSVLRNIFVATPPTVSSPVVEFIDDKISYSFTISNPMNYKTFYYLEINNIKVVEETCQESTDYTGEYSPVAVGDKCKFYVTFTNSIDYRKTIYTNEFVAK